MTDRIVVLELAQLEAAHLSDLVGQFEALLRGTPGGDALHDPAIARLVPDAYRDDAAASDEFRSMTQGELLDRRVDDAAVVLASLRVDGRPVRVEGLDEDSARTVLTLPLDATQTAAWLRTLTSLRLVMASRLGIGHESDHDPEDPRFGVYDWLGYRLEGLLQALED